MGWYQREAGADTVAEKESRSCLNRFTGSVAPLPLKICYHHEDESRRRLSKPDVIAEECIHFGKLV